MHQYMQVLHNMKTKKNKRDIYTNYEKPHSHTQHINIEQKKWKWNALFIYLFILGGGG